MLGFIIGGAVPAFAQTSDPRGGSFTQADRDLLTRQQIRLDTFEESLKELRGQVELEVKNTRTQMEKLSASVLANTSGASGDAQAIQSELARLNDSITILNQRLSRTIEMSSDIEFRVLRLEKRLSTLLQLSDASITDKIVQDDVSGAGVPADVSLSEMQKPDRLSGRLISQSWTHRCRNSPTLLKIIQRLQHQMIICLSSLKQTIQHPQSRQLDPEPEQAEALAQQPAPAPTPEILPDVSPEEQYRFALGRALQNDLSTAEQAFAEFRAFHAEHERASDALFWLGRVQFMLGKYEDSAMTFSEFNTAYASDPRLVETTLWIAESVTQFASDEQACDVYNTLTQLVEQPPESFTKRLGELTTAANCPAL